MDKTTQERILEDANRLYRGRPDSHHPSNYKYIDGYIAGATAENNRAEELKKLLDEAQALLSAEREKAWLIVNALEQYNTRHEGGLLPDRFTYEKAVKTLEQWKGTGKEVENG